MVWVTGAGHNVENDNMMYYFDKDTITISRGSKTVWMRTVNRDDSKNRKDFSSATKTRFDCNRRIMQVLSHTRFNNSGEPTISKSTPEPEYEPIPGSIGAELYRIVCARSFPNEKSTYNYTSIPEGTDIFEATKLLTEIQRLNNKKPYK